MYSSEFIDSIVDEKRTSILPEFAESIASLDSRGLDGIRADSDDSKVPYTRRKITFSDDLHLKSQLWDSFYRDESNASISKTTAPATM